MPLLTTRAVLLRAHPYSESSRILRFYTRDGGVVATLARGVRKSGGRGGGGIESFAEGSLTLLVRDGRDLQTFKDFAVTRPRRALGASPLSLGGASLLAELVLRHSAEEPNAPLFDALGAALDRLEAAGPGELIAVALSETWQIVSALGYHPVLQACVHCGAPLGSEEMSRFDFAAGGVRCQSCGEDGPRVGPGARAQLTALVSGNALPLRVTRPRAHLQLLSDFVTYHVSGTRPLGSFAFLAQMLPDDDA